jgi:hypothetical protein
MSIKEFIDNSILADTTKSNHLCRLKRIEKELGYEIVEATEIELWNVSQNLADIKCVTKRKYQHAIKSYLEYLNVPTPIFTKNLTKEMIDGEFKTPNIIETEDPVIELNLPTLETLKERINEIINPSHRLLFNLLTCYSTVLRTDLANVKIRNYKETEPHLKDNIIVFPSINKVKINEPIILELNEVDIQLLNQIKFNDEFLIPIDCEPKNRNNNYSKLITKLSKRYFSLHLNQNCFRKIATTQSISSVSHLNIKEQNAVLNEQARLRGHSVSTARSFYLQDTDFINICPELTKTLIIVDSSGGVQKSYLVEDIIRIMELYNK